MSKEQLEAEFRADIRKEIHELRMDVKKLLGFMAWLFGASAAVSAVVSLLIAVYFRK